MKILKTHKSFDGLTQFWSHNSLETKTEMKFSTFIPEGEVKGCLIWLSGLTCTEENFITKAGAQKFLAQSQLMVISPDTSPRGLNLPFEHDSYDFGSGAGFYVDAKTEGYKDHYRMDSYIIKEIYPLIQNHFKIKNVSIAGHSMGGHGALVLALRNPSLFKSVSAFSPIVNPMKAPWGIKAFSGYLGSDQKVWSQYDTCQLLSCGHLHPCPILIHQGSKDEFLERELLTNNFIIAATESKQAHEVKMCPDYDHSYYFISTFMEEHIKHHEKYLSQIII
jgi:S-formylglutathione hydrolase